MAITQDSVLEKLKNVIDPELFVNVVDLGLIYEIKLSAADASNEASAEGATEPPTTETSSPPEPAPGPAATSEPPSSSEAITKVHIDMTMTSPACPAGPQLIGGAKREVGSIEGVGEVEVRIVLDPPWTPDRMTEDAKDQLGIF